MIKYKITQRQHYGYSLSGTLAHPSMMESDDDFLDEGDNRIAAISILEKLISGELILCTTDGALVDVEVLEREVNEKALILVAMYESDIPFEDAHSSDTAQEYRDACKALEAARAPKPATELELARAVCQAVQKHYNQNSKGLGREVW